MKKIIFILITSLLVIVACKNNDDNMDLTNQIKVQYIEQICCGNLKTLNNQLVNSHNESYKDSILAPINFADFPLLESIQAGEIITIFYELTEKPEASCDMICNRRNGIPIKIIHVEN